MIRTAFDTALFRFTCCRSGRGLCTPWVLAVTVGLAASIAMAGAEQRFASHRLVDALVERGMTDLLEHLVASDPAADPAESLELVYRIHLSRWEDTTTGLTMRVEQLQLGIEKIRDLVARFPDHISRPIWQTDLAGLLLFQTLDNAEVAGLFYEFGVPTDRQAEIFEAAVAEAIQELFDAAHRLFILQGELPKKADHTEKRVNTGQWSRLIDQYAKLRTPFYTGLACLYAAMLPDTHPFYADLAKPNRKLPRRANTIEAERDRLRRHGVFVLEQIVENQRDTYGVRTAALSVTGRLLLAQGRDEQAAAFFADVAALAKSDTVPHLVLQAARTRMAHAAGDTAAWQDLVETMRASELSGRDIFALLLVTDLEHRLRVQDAGAATEDKRTAVLAEAYRVYDTLFNDPRYAARADDVRRYVYGRWKRAVAEAENLSDLPSMMLRAAGRLTIDEGEVLRSEAGAAAGAEQATHWDKALEHYRRAIQIYTVLRSRPDLTAADRAEAGFNMGLAIYRQDEQSDELALEAASQWLALAIELPEQQVSGVAISHAADVVGELRRAHPDDTEIDDFYHRVVTTMFEVHPHAPGVQRRRVYHAEDVLMPAGRYAEAIELLGVLAARSSKPSIYFAAQTNLLICLQALHDAASSETQVPRRAAWREAAKRVGEEARAALQGGETDGQGSIATALANAVMAEAAMLLVEGKAAAAAERLRSIETIDVPANVLNAARSQLIVALAQMGEAVRAREEAERLMATAPDEAASVIYEVVTGMGRQVETMRLEAAMPTTTDARRQALGEQSRSMAAGSVRLATLLVEWARKQPGYSEADVAGVRIVLARAKTVAGMTGAAIEDLKNIVAALDVFQDDLGWLNAMGEAEFQGGASQPGNARSDAQRKHLIESAKWYDTILSGVQPDATGGYPPLWWNAWMRRLQVSDILDTGTEDISLRVRQLRLTDPELGGQPYKGELIRLENKHRVR